MEERSEALERALAYPYAAPPHSFLQRGPDTLALGEGEVDLSARTPMVAYGANASPRVLAHKLGATGEEIPALRARLEDFDVVYSAHISPYGSIPATLRPSCGARARAFVLYLTAEQVRLMSETELNYTLAPLPGTACRLEDGPAPAQPLAYLTRHGNLLLDGSEVALAEVEAPGRVLPAMSQRQVLERVSRALCPERTLERFVLETAADPHLAAEWAERLERTPPPRLRWP